MHKQGLTALLALTLAGALATSAASADETLPVPEIERIVREYLLREPEVIYQAIQELQKKQRAEEAARQQAAVVSNRDEIFGHGEDPVAGAPDGKVTLVEFFDYQCGYCRSMSADLQKLIKGHKDLRFVFKELPVLGPDSLMAAKAALAANRLDPRRYPDFHFALMQSRELSREAVLKVAAEQGYDEAALAREMEAGWVAAHIEATRSLAEKLGINGTPSFVIGDTLIPGAVEVSELARRINAELEQAN